MAPDLMEFGGALSLGAFFLLSLWYVAAITFPSLPSLFSRFKVGSHLLGVGLVTALSFAAGVVLQDASDLAVEKAGFLAGPLPSEDEVRREALEEAGDLLDAVGTKTDLLASSDTAIAFKVAKNRVFKEDNYFEELQAIQDRVYFTRGLTLAALVLFLLVLAALVYRAAIPATEHSIAEPQRKILLLFLLAALGLYGAARFAYTAEEQALTKRVFAYYVELEGK